MNQQERFRCTIVRGGTSKGVFMMRNELPQDPKLRDKVILAIYGTPDIRQIDGLGGADFLTSKFAMIGPPTRPDADVDYTFGQVGILLPKVDYTTTCGNISAGVGPFAIHHGLVDIKEPITNVTIHLTNNNRILKAEIPIVDGELAVEGDCKIDGCPGTGAKIRIDWSDTAGIVTQKILPTGNAKDVLSVEGIGDVTVSIVDAGNPVVFLHAERLGFKGTESPFEIEEDKGLLDKLERIRSVAAQRIGFVKDWKNGTKDSQFLPFIAMVNSASDFIDYTTGKTVGAESCDVMSRLLFNQKMHKTYPGTGTISTGTAAQIPGTVVNELLKESAKKKKEVRIGHPAGVITIEVDAGIENNKPFLKKAVIIRTARIIMDGYVYVRKSLMQ